MTDSAWFEGVDRLNRLAVDLGDAGARATFQASKAVRKTAADIAADAQAIVPVDTGNLRASISASALGTDRPLAPGDLAAEIGPTADYGGFVEYGTARQAPQAYMGPSFDRRAPDLAHAVEEFGGEIL